MEDETKKAIEALTSEFESDIEKSLDIHAGDSQGQNMNDSIKERVDLLSATGMSVDDLQFVDDEDFDCKIF